MSAPTKPLPALAASNHAPANTPHGSIPVSAPTTAPRTTVGRVFSLRNCTSSAFAVARCAPPARYALTAAHKSDTATPIAATFCALSTSTLESNPAPRAPKQNPARE